MDGEAGFELLLVAGAGLKSRRRRRTRNKDRIYHILNLSSGVCAYLKPLKYKPHHHSKEQAEKRRYFALSPST